jgi:hypothetical protein
VGTEQIVLLSQEAWDFVHASLRNGTGLSAACEGMNINVQAMSAFLATKPNTLAQCQGECTMGFKALTTIINNHAADQDVSKWRDGHRALKDFVKTVNLWEQHCKRAEVEPQRISEAFYTYRYPQEVATVVGMTMPEFWTYVLGNVNLKTYLIESKFITG